MEFIYMRHCCKFQAMDIWFLYDTPQFTQRKLEFGICPKCGMPLAILLQFDLIKGGFFYIKKYGMAAQKFVNSFQKQKWVSATMVDKKLKPVTYKWVYGVNKELKNGVNQYAKDFYGSSVLIKKKN